MGSEVVVNHTAQVMGKDFLAYYCSITVGHQTTFGANHVTLPGGLVGPHIVERCNN